MTIEFYKSKKHAQSTAKEIRKFTKRRGIRAVKVKVEDSSLLRNYGGRHAGKRTSPGKGELGYVIDFPKMKQTGLRRVR